MDDEIVDYNRRRFVQGIAVTGGGFIGAAVGGRHGAHATKQKFTEALSEKPENTAQKEAATGAKIGAGLVAAYIISKEALMAFTGRVKRNPADTDDHPER